jgi:peptidoglycan DL-endopeptidase CwlO
MVDTALHYLGAPYLYGGSSPGGFDCSGLALYVSGKLGVTLPHYSGSQYACGTPVAPDQLQPGDLVFFGDPVYHVGIYVGAGNMIDAPCSGSFVKIESMKRSDYSKACRIPLTAK